MKTYYCTHCRDCVGSRRTLGLIDGQFGGKPVKKISKSGDYDVITFAEFKSSTQCLATGLRKKYSLGKGDKVLIFANSRAEWLIAGRVNIASFTRFTFFSFDNQRCPWNL